MKYGLTEGCLGCRCLAEGKRAQGHSEGCRARLEAEIAKTEEGRIGLTTAYLRGLDRESAGAPGAVPAPPNPDVQDIPMDTAGTSRKRSAEDAGHVMDDADRGGAQPEPSSVADDSMKEARREAEALGADAVALAEAYSPARFQQRAGAFGLSAGVAMDLRLGWDLGREADQVKAQKRLSDEKSYLLILSPCAWLSHSCKRSTRSRNDWQSWWSRADVIWSLHAVWQSRRSSEVDAFSSSILGRRRRGTNRT